MSRQKLPPAMRSLIAESKNKTKHEHENQSKQRVGSAKEERQR